MKQMIGVIFLLGCMTGILSGCEDEEALRRQIAQAEERLAIAEERAGMAEQKALLAERELDLLRERATGLGYIGEDGK